MSRKFFPLFIELTGKKCVVAGGGNVAVRKVKTLLKFDADITVISPEITDELKEIVDGGQVKYLQRQYRYDDIDDAFLVIAATSEREVNHAIFRRCEMLKIWGDIADCPKECSFMFPAVSDSDNVVVGITTSGENPSLSHQIREEVDDILPRIISGGKNVNE